MKRAALITNAGLSNRFSESLGRQVLKCIYYDKNVTDSLLGKQLNILAFDYPHLTLPTILLV